MWSPGGKHNGNGHINKDYNDYGIMNSDGNASRKGIWLDLDFMMSRRMEILVKIDKRFI